MVLRRTLDSYDSIPRSEKKCWRRFRAFRQKSSTSSTNTVNTLMEPATPEG